MMNSLNSKHFTSFEPIRRGLSEEKKYHVIEADGAEYLLRISSLEQTKSIISMFEIQKLVIESGINICLPIEYGICNENELFRNGVYTLHSWINGKSFETLLPLLLESSHHCLGRKTGEILKKIHSIPFSKDTPPWSSRYFNVMDDKIREFIYSDFDLEHQKDVLEYLKLNRFLVADCMQCLRHGDFSVGNLILDENKDIVVIDWEQDDFDNYGDPWLDFTDIFWSACISPSFASGVIFGYFKEEPSLKFWKRLKFYIFTAILTSINTIGKNRENLFDKELRFYNEALKWYNNLTSEIPIWYSPQTDKY